MIQKICYYLYLLIRHKNYHVVKYKGKNNKLIVHLANGRIIENPFLIDNLKIRFTKNNSVVEIYEPNNLAGSTLYVGNNDHFKFFRNVFGHILVVGGQSAYLEVGEETTMQNTKFYLNSESNVSVKIGKDCMFSYDIAVWASDTHKILDKTTNEVLNKSKYGIEIGNHVWCGTRVTILKDVRISNDSIIGAGSLVCGRFDEPNLIIGGNPAKAIKKSVIWKREGFL